MPTVLNRAWNVADIAGDVVLRAPLPLFKSGEIVDVNAAWHTLVHPADERQRHVMVARAHGGLDQTACPL